MSEVTSVCFSVKGKKWFGDDGRIVALPDPIKESSTRPPLFHMEEDLDPALQPVYRKVRRTLCIHGALNTKTHGGPGPLLLGAGGSHICDRCHLYSQRAAAEKRQRGTLRKTRCSVFEDGGQGAFH